MVKAMTFDVFGTVVDWRSSIIREGEQLTARTGIEVDWPRFALAWRAGYAQRWVGCAPESYPGPRSTFCTG